MDDFWLHTFVSTLMKRQSRWKFFLFLHKNIHCGYSSEAPRWGASDEYPQYMFMWRNKKNMTIFSWQNSLIYSFATNVLVNVLIRHWPAVLSPREKSSEAHQPTTVFWQQEFFLIGFEFNGTINTIKVMSSR